MSKIDRLKEIVAENLGASVEDLTEDTKFIEDLNADSLDIVELTMAIEEEFDVSIDDEELENIKTIGDILNYIE